MNHVSMQSTTDKHTHDYTPQRYKYQGPVSIDFSATNVLDNSDLERMSWSEYLVVNVTTLAMFWQRKKMTGTAAHD